MNHLRAMWRAASDVDDYGMRHRPDGPDDGSPTMDRMTEMFPEDVYEHPEHYGGRGNPEACRQLKAAEGKPNAMIKIYRACPIEATEINNGDWVTTDRGYAKMHGESNLSGSEEYPREWHILTATVPARSLYTGANDVNEWGYWGSDIRNAKTARFAGTMFRGMRLRMGPEALKRYVELLGRGDQKRAAEKIVTEMERSGWGGGGVGWHWTTSEDVATNFAYNHHPSDVVNMWGSTPCQIPVVLRSSYTSDMVETDERNLDFGGVRYLSDDIFELPPEHEIPIVDQSPLTVDAVSMPVPVDFAEADEALQTGKPRPVLCHWVTVPLRRQVTATAPLTLYHGTLEKHVDSIRSEGLRPPQGVMGPARWFMLTTSRDQAARYTSSRPGAVVLEYRLPGPAVERYLWAGVPHDVYGFEATAYAIREPVPGSYLVASEPL